MGVFSKLKVLDLGWEPGEDVRASMREDFLGTFRQGRSARIELDQAGVMEVALRFGGLSERVKKIIY